MSPGLRGDSAESGARIGIALYVHWPFCKSKCPYCDFNSHVRDAVEQERWRKALLAELDHAAAETPGRRVDSIFFGGGTPSLMPPGTVAALLDRAASRWSLAAEVEVTLEANPTSVEAARFIELRAAGVNRLSLGVQALDDAALRFLGRGHDVSEALAALALARRHFARYSFDLIYARPGQTQAQWRAELARAAALAGDHLSVYQLTIEPGTAFAAAHARGDWRLPEDELAGALYEATQERLEAAGLAAYEISNHARSGGECRHNLAYWRYQDYVGIGPGAHGRITLDGVKHATRRRRAPETWLAAVEREGHGLEERVALAPEQRRAEMLMMGLRLAQGIERDHFRAEAGVALEDALDGDRLADLVAGGFLVLDEGGLRATPAGRQRLNSVLAALGA
jgi:putative oxygen-independent coproporphyrinogen III oxidase